MSSSKISILFVEDDPDLGNVLTLYLHMNGFEVSHFENGRDAIKALGSLTPDICLLDVNIPEIDGFELAQQIKGKRAIPFIFLTARKQKEDRLRGCSSVPTTTSPNPSKPTSWCCASRISFREPSE